MFGILFVILFWLNFSLYIYILIKKFFSVYYIYIYIYIYFSIGCPLGGVAQAQGLVGLTPGPALHVTITHNITKNP